MGDKVKVRTLDAETQEILVKLFRGYRQGFARFGDAGYLLPSFYEKHADNLKTIPVRPEDVWVATFPRSGTTWTQELVWLLMNDHDYETALKIPLTFRYLFVLLPSIFREDVFHNVDGEDGEIPERLKKLRPLQQLSDAPSPRFIIKDMLPEDFSGEIENKELSLEYLARLPSMQEVSEAPSPRFMKTHLPLSLLPDNLLDTSKVVYVARDPRDVAVSFYHLSKFLKGIGYVGDFKTFWNLFVNDSVNFTPYFPHVKEAWARRNHPNMLFIFYEELQQNLSASIKRIAKFLGKEVTSEQIQKLCEHLDIKNFKNNASVNPPWLPKVANPGEEGFIRNGKSGGWRKYYDEGMAAQAQRWLHAQLADTDLRFPDAPVPQ